MPMPDISIAQLAEAFETFKGEVKAKIEDPEVKARVEAVLDAQEEKNQQLFAAKQAADQQAEEFKSRIETLEADLARSIQEKKSSEHYRDSAEYKALNYFAKEGKAAVFSHEEYKATLRTDDNANGGFLVPVIYERELIKNIFEISPVRSVARVMTIDGKTVELPKQVTIPTSAFEGEYEAAPESNATYELDTITPYRQTFETPITLDQLMNSAFDMESLMGSDAELAFAVNEGNKHILGTGVKQPEGILVNADIGVTNSTLSGGFNPEDLATLTGELKAGYNPVFMMNRKTLANLRGKNTNGQWLWQPGLNGSALNQIAGYPYVIAADMPDLAATAKSIAFGDFRQGYRIVDRRGISVVRDDFTLASKATVKFIWHRWTTGQVVQPEAIQLLNIIA